MSRVKKARLISILFTLLLALFVVFALLNSITDSSSAPLIGDAADNDISAIPNPPDSSDISDDIGAPLDEASQLEKDGFTIIQMDLSDINKGNLILVNSDAGFEIPDENDLVDIDSFKTKSYRVADSALLLSASIIEPLNEMMDAFYEETGCGTVTVISAYRDFSRQQEILDEFTAIVGRAEAKKRAALPGHSEHHAGLAIDFGVFSEGNLRTFFGTGSTGWFLVHSYKYGFIPRYPEDKTEITKTTYEPWHFRYVGNPHAHFIRQDRLCFEEYIELIMGFTRDEPYSASFDDADYEVYFTQDPKIFIPPDCEAEISGNNINGFIVTLKLPQGPVVIQ